MEKAGTLKMLKRDASSTLLNKTKHYPVLALTGPRQAGKSTLAKTLFPNKPYCSLEDLDNRQFASEDPKRFLAQFKDGVILDEVQHVPALFSYIQTIVDEDQRTGLFVLTGSQQFMLHEKISQSLAGRAGFIQLLPFNLNELQQGGISPNSLETLLFTGGYPPIYDRKIPPMLWQSDYVMTYLERDIRQLINVSNLQTFHKFLQMCAARTGQLINLSNLANDCGITHNTAKAWISVLEASYILFLLPPHHNNLNKRLIKSPKLYFYDTGLACFLAGIQNKEQLITHRMRGAIFETWVISEFMKNRFNHGLLSNLYFWRDSQGNEVDLIIEDGETSIPIEIKSGETITVDYFKGLNYFQKLYQSSKPSWLIYAGTKNQKRKEANIIGWQNLQKALPKDNEKT